MKKSKLSAAMLFSALGLFFTFQPAGAQEISVSPPPLAYPKFSEPNTTQAKVTGTYMSISGDNFDLTVLGASFTGRSVLDRTKSDQAQGLGYAGGAFFLSGNDLSGVLFTALGNYELELFNKGESNLIGFAGPNITYAFIGSDTTDIELFMGGFQVGAQYSIQSDDLLLSPFFMYVSSGGSVWVNGEETGFDSEVTLIGFDALIVSKGITLSGFLQDAFGDSESDSLILQVSFTFGPQGKVSKEDPPPKTARRDGYQPMDVQRDSLWARYR